MKKHILSIMILSILTIFLFSQSQAWIDAGYRVQVGKYRVLEYAQNKMDALQKAGFMAYSLFNEDLYTIYVGQYTSISEARQVRDQLQQLGFDALISLIEDVRVTHEALEHETKVTNYVFPYDVKVQGVLQTYTFNFNTDTHWEMQEGSYLELVFNRTPLQVTETATLSVYFNDTPLYSTFINKMQEETVTIKVLLPKASFWEIYNRIDIKTYQRITTQPCEDELNPGNWMVLKKSSYVHLRYKMIEDSFSLKEFPYPFIQPYRLFPVQCAVLVPEIEINPYTEAAMQMIATLGAVSGEVEDTITLLPVSQYLENEAAHAIYVGSVNRLPQSLQNILEAEVIQKSERQVVLQEVAYPGRQGHMLLILCDQPHQLKEAIHLLRDDKLVGQMLGTTQVISSEMDPSRPPKRSDILTLKAMGYASSQVSGEGYKKIAFYQTVPDHWAVNKGASFTIDMRYSRLIDFERAGLSVFINNIPVDSYVLTKEKAAKDQVVIAIPQDLLDESAYYIELSFYLKLEDDICAYRDDPNAWAYILDSSALYLPHAEKQTYTLSDYIHPFVSDFCFKETCLVLPDQVDLKDLQMAASIVFYLGAFANDARHLVLTEAPIVEAHLLEYKQIIIGTWQNNSQLRTLNQHLLMPYNETTGLFERVNQTPLLYDFNKNITAIQLLPKSEQSANYTLAVGATNKDVLEQAVAYLTRPQYVNRLDGQIALVDGNGRMVSYEASALTAEEQKQEVQEESKLETFINKLVTETDAMYFLIGFMSIVLLIVILTLFLWRFKR